MNKDISEILDEWEYDPESNVRRIRGKDGVPRIQVRVDQGAFQGILQLNLDGRPDGKRPHDHDFALEHYREMLEAHRQEAGDETGFQLDHSSCEELFEESSQVYGRYVFLLQVKDFERVIRDTERNMACFEFLHSYAALEGDRTNLQKWWPYILRIHGTAKSHLLADDGRFDRAMAVIRDTRQRIRDLEEVDAEEFHSERERSVEALDELLLELKGRKPLSEREGLEQELAEAIADEAFERAAQLRDQLRDLPDAVTSEADESDIEGPDSDLPSGDPPDFSPPDHFSPPNLGPPGKD